MSQQHQRQHTDHLHLGPRLFDQAAAEEACRVDAAEDRKWFEQNPHRDKRERPATDLELQATGHPPRTRVLVVRGPFGTQFRCFLEND